MLASSLNLRTATDADWQAMSLLGATSFGGFVHPDSMTAWRSAMPADSTLVACDGRDIVGMAHYLDLQLTVPGGAVLPAAGVTWVAVSPTHRRRGVLRAMYTELHERIADKRYPIAALTASEGGIYSRFGYGPATIERELTIDRRVAEFHADVPDPGGVRSVRPAEERDEICMLYDRWRRETPGGLFRSQTLWDDVFADHEKNRSGGSEWFAFLHPDGYALYRTHGDGQSVARVDDVTAGTPEAHVALWRALLGLDLREKVIYKTYPDDPLPYLLTDARAAATSAVEDDLWLRIMDIPAALEARRYQGELSAVLEVVDGFRSDGGRFALQIRDGQAQCTPTDAPADIRMNLDVLGSLYLGAHHPSVFVNSHRLHSNKTGLIQRLGAAFASDVPAELGYRF